LNLMMKVGLNLIVIRDTQSSRKRFSWAGEVFFLTFGFKEAFCVVTIATLANSYNLCNVASHFLHYSIELVNVPGRIIIGKVWIAVGVLNYISYVV